jgi:hypothetical protein
VRDSVDSEPQCSPGKPYGTLYCEIPAQIEASPDDETFASPGRCWTERRPVA